MIKALPVLSALAIVAGCSPSAPPVDGTTDDLPQATACGLFANNCVSLQGASPVSVAAADLDGDGDLDLAVVNFGSDNVSILLNNGHGAFTEATRCDVDPKPQAVAAGDWDGDGDIDLASANWGRYTLGQFFSTVSILHNNGDATFAQAVHVSFGDLFFPNSIAAADLNADDHPDLATANVGMLRNVSIFRNNGQGTFTLASSPTTVTTSSSYFVVAAHLNADNRPDLAVANFLANNVSILLNTGPGQNNDPAFASAQNFNTGSSPYALTPADLDGDADIDLAVASYGSDTVSVLRNNGTGQFAAAPDLVSGRHPVAIAAGDLDGDGDSDLIVANLGRNDVDCEGGSLQTFLNNGDATFAQPQDLDVGIGPRSVAAGDFDSDGDLDLAVANFCSDTVVVLLNDGHANFTLSD